MKHYTLLKLAPGADARGVLSKIRKAYEKLDLELDWANRPVVFPTCLEDHVGADIMAVIELDGPDQLKALTEHPICIELQEKIGDAVLEKLTFDHY